MGIVSLPGWDTFVLAVPILIIFAFWILGLDERLGSPKHITRPPRNFCEVDANGGATLSDPDGRIWQALPVRQIEARIVREGGSGRMETRLGERGR